MCIYTIYKHTSPSGKSYIGLTKDLSRRNSEHRSAKGNSRAFHAAINKYGWDNFIHTILLDNLTFDEAGVAESRLITEHSTLSPAGYNLTSGGHTSKQVSDETRLLLSVALKGRPSPNKGKVLSGDTKTKMSASAKVKVITEEHRTNRETARLLTITKTFIVTFPDGTQENVINLKQWCEHRNYNYGTASNNSRRKYPVRCGELKGFKFSQAAE